MIFARWCWLAWAAGVGVWAQTASPLTLEEVLNSVEKNYPPLLVALQERPIAEADVLAALGRFDLVARARNDQNRLGRYDYQSTDVGIEQGLAFQGMSYSAGWNRGSGDFPGYLGGLITRSTGEYRAGVRVPLFRDRAIDGRRADLQRAEIGVRLAELSIDQQRLAIIQLATRRYWDWVAAGRRYAVVKQVLDIAQARDQQLRDAARLGQIPDFDVLDNERIILQRQSQLVEAERQQQQAAFDLSLFYRDERGEPVVAALDRTPVGFPALTALDQQRMLEDIQAALQRRPELERLRQQRAQTDVERRLARNQTMPNIDFGFNYFQDTGRTARVLAGPQELRTSVTFELPFQRRNAFGRLYSADARIRQIEQRERFARDQIVAEVKDAYSAVVTAFQRANYIKNEVVTTRRVEDGERARFELGDTNLFTLNLRELATAEAAIREVNALADYYRAFALYDLSVAQALARRPLVTPYQRPSTFGWPWLKTPALTPPQPLPARTPSVKEGQAPVPMLLAPPASNGPPLQ
jgi:outer membrane protein TolC